MPADHDSPDGPTPLRLAVFMIWLEAAGVGFFALWIVLDTLVSTPDNLAFAILLAACVGFLAGGLGLAGRALTYRRRWGYSVGILAQLIPLPVVWFMLVGHPSVGVTIGGAAMGLAILVALGSLLAPSSRRVLSPASH